MVLMNEVRVRLRVLSEWCYPVAVWCWLSDEEVIRSG